MHSRRGFLFAAASFLAAPAIVRATSIMPVKSFSTDVLDSSTDDLVVKSTERYAYGFIGRGLWLDLEAAYNDASARPSNLELKRMADDLAELIKCPGT